MMARSYEDIEQELEIVYAALLTVNKRLNPEHRRLVLKARLAAMRAALGTACQLAGEKLPDDWTKFRARELAKARNRHAAL
jgi:hypothetical protein